MNPDDFAEKRLADAYRRQARHYDDALCIVNERAQPLELNDWANDLQFALQQVAKVEQDMAADKLAWKNAGRNPGIELRDILASVATQIQSLATAIDRRSMELLAKKQRLLPALDEFIRHRDMLQSYGHYGKTK